MTGLEESGRSLCMPGGDWISEYKEKDPHNRDDMWLCLHKGKGLIVQLTLDSCCQHHAK